MKSKGMFFSSLKHRKVVCKKLRSELQKWESYRPGHCYRLFKPFPVQRRRLWLIIEVQYSIKRDALCFFWSDYVCLTIFVNPFSFECVLVIVVWFLDHVFLILNKIVSSWTTSCIIGTILLLLILNRIVSCLVTSSYKRTILIFHGPKNSFLSNEYNARARYSNNPRSLILCCESLEK